MTMPELGRIYDQGFFQEWGAANHPYVESARIIADVLMEQWHPRRLIDLGCGCAAHAHFFQQEGVEVVCLDGVRAPAQLSFGLPVLLCDLTVPMENPWGGFDLSLCLDVGEHIPEELSEPFLGNITRFSDTLLMSCAPPGQGGHHHVNEQPKRYWIQRLRSYGFAYDRKRTGVLCEIFKRRRTPLMWMWEHISVYQRADGASPGPSGV